MKVTGNQVEEAKAFHQVVVASGHYKQPERSGKRTKLMTDTLSGKRTLDLGVARSFLPPNTVMYETTDGKRVRVFFGQRRRSTSAMVSIGKARCLMHNLKWAWSTYEAQQHTLGISQVDVCPYDFGRVKL